MDCNLTLMLLVAPHLENERLGNPLKHSRFSGFLFAVCMPKSEIVSRKRLCLFPFMFGKSTECTTFKRDEDETRHNEHPVFHSENQTAEKR